MKSLAPLILAIPLLLSGCATDPGETPAVAPATPATTTDASAGLQELILGETLTITHCGDDVPCEVDITLREATLTETCPYGVSFPDMQTMDPDQTQYLTFEGEFHVIDASTNFSMDTMDFTAVDPDGYATSDLTASDCDALDIDDRLSSPVAPGLKRDGHLILAIPENTATVRFTQFWDPVTYEFDVTTLDVEAGAGERPLPSSPIPASAPESAEETITSMPPAEPATSASIWNEPGIGYNCASTDAWTDDPANCTAANLGGDPAYDIYWGPDAALPAGESAQDLSNVPFADGGTCPAYECGYGTNDQGQRNPTSGEIQTLDGCQQGYIIDPELCEAVAWVETHQY